MISERQAILSIHDVMPENLGLIERIRQNTEAHKCGPPALLVVPGREWRPEHLRRLRQWERDGCELVAHGWHHQTRPTRLMHRAHATLLSRNVAEHLALNPDEIVTLMRDSRTWFESVGLTPPRTYVPPAWALGMHDKNLQALPFDCVETLSGIHLRCGHERWIFCRLPLAGFEADTHLRAGCLRIINWLQGQFAERFGKPIRIAIHPRDPELLLSDALAAMLQQEWTSLRYSDLPAQAACW